MKNGFYVVFFLILLGIGYFVQNFHFLRIGELYSLLDSACFVGNETCVQILLKAKADPTGVKGYEDFHKNVDKIGIEFNSPLAQAVMGGYLSIVKILLEAGANPNIPVGEGYTPLIFAVKKNRLEIVKILLSHGADTQYKSFEGTALEIAEREKKTEIIQLLRNSRG